MSSQQEASGFAHSSRPASETGFERNFIHPSYKELLAQVPKEGREFITSLSFYNSMSEAASGARAEGSITVDINNVKAVREFSRFLALKLYTTDTMADKISPTPLMDAIWHQLILDTLVYEKLQEVIGFKLHHRPSGAFETDARKVRLVVMESLYTKFFEEVPFGTVVRASAVINNLETPFGAANRVSPSSKKRKMAAKSSLRTATNSTTLSFKTMTGRTFATSVDNDTPNGWAYRIQDHEGIPPDLIRAICNGRELLEHETIRSLSLVDGDIVGIIPTLKGC